MRETNYAQIGLWHPTSYNQDQSSRTLSHHPLSRGWCFALPTPHLCMYAWHIRHRLVGVVSRVFFITASVCTEKKVSLCVRVFFGLQMAICNEQLRFLVLLLGSYQQ